MKTVKLPIPALILALPFFLGCVLPAKPCNDRPLNTPVFDALISHKPENKQPLLNSFEAGTKAFDSSSGAEEAISVFETTGPYFVYFCSYSCVPEGVQTPHSFENVKRVLSDKRFGRVDIPASSCVRSKESRDYLDASIEYTREFNAKMLELVDGKK